MKGKHEENSNLKQNANVKWILSGHRCRYTHTHTHTHTQRERERERKCAWKHSFVINKSIHKWNQKRKRKLVNW
jgi:hypothetical protein